MSGCEDSCHIISVSPPLDEAFPFPRSYLGFRNPCWIIRNYLANKNTSSWNTLFLEQSGSLNEFVDSFVPKHAASLNDDRNAIRFSNRTERREIDTNPANDD